MTEFIDQLLGNDVATPVIYSADIVAFNLLVAMVLGMIIGLVYKQVHKGISYSQSYVYSIVVVTMTVSLAMMVIGNDITRAFALLGTFTIIRYRTAVKDPKDTAFIFIAPGYRPGCRRLELRHRSRGDLGDDVCNLVLGSDQLRSCDQDRPCSLHDCRKPVRD